MSVPTATQTRPVSFLTQPGSNRKLGPLIHSWSLPAIATCPGATDFCKSLCYATRGHFLNTNVTKLYARNLVLSRRPDFAAKMIRQIHGSLARTVRVHVSGDFYSAAYARKWQAIIEACPSVEFFAWTRSWRKKAMLPALVDLGALPNMQLWWSEDHETGPSPVVPGIRACFLVRTVADEALVDPSRHALVFREEAHRKVGLYPGQLKAVNGSRVCPVEQLSHRVARPEGKPGPKVTCSSCRLCINPARLKEATLARIPRPPFPGHLGNDRVHGHRGIAR